MVVSLQALFLLTLIPSVFTIKCYQGYRSYQDNSIRDSRVDHLKCDKNYDYCAWQAETHSTSTSMGDVKMSYYCASSSQVNSATPVCQNEACFSSARGSLSVVTCCCKGDYCNNSGGSKFTLLGVSFAILTYFYSKLL